LSPILAAKTGPKIVERIYDGGRWSAGFLCESLDYLKSKGKRTTKELDTWQTRTFCSKEKRCLAYVIAIINMILHGMDSRASSARTPYPRTWVPVGR